MRFEVLTTAKMSVLFFWVVMSCGLVDRNNVSEKYNVFIFRTAKDADSMFLRISGIFLHVHMLLLLICAHDL
jgi:hypothetical protein